MPSVLTTGLPKCSPATTETPMPTMGQATVAAIYVLNIKDGFQLQIPYSKERREADMKGFVQTLSDGLALPAKEFVTSFELLAMIDLQLGAVLEHGALDKDPLADARENVGGDDGDEEYDMDRISCKRLYATLYLNAKQGSMVKETLSDSSVVLDSMNSYEAFLDMKDAYDKGMQRTVVNSILMVAAVLVPIWTLDWKWYWRLALSVVALFVVILMFTRKSARHINDNYLTKFSKMASNYEYHIAKLGGLIEPKSKVKEMEKSRNGFWWGLIIGGLVGLLFTPLGMIVGAVVGAILGSVASGSEDTHGEGWQEIKICSPARQWITTVIMAALILLEIYCFFL